MGFFFRPLRGSNNTFPAEPHGLRRGLHSFAASRLRLGKTAVSRSGVSRGTRLSEDVFHFSEKGAQQGLVVDLRQSIQFLQQLFLTFVEFRGNLHEHLDI